MGEAREKRRPVTIRLGKEEQRALLELEKAWKCNTTEAIRKTILASHGGLGGILENSGPNIVEKVVEREVVVVRAPTVEEIREAMKDFMRESRPEVEEEPEKVSAVPVFSNQRKSYAQVQREDLERRAAAAGKCPDCGYDAQYCACGATAAV